MFAGYLGRLFIPVIPFSLQHSTMKQELSTSFHGWGRWTLRSRNLLKGMPLIGGQRNTEIHQVWGLSAPPPPKPTSQPSHAVTWVMTQDLWPQSGVVPLLPWHLLTPLVWSLTSSQGSALPVCPVGQLTTSPAESENYTVPGLEVAEFFGNVIPFIFPRDN